MSDLWNQRLFGTSIVGDNDEFSSSTLPINAIPQESEPDFIGWDRIAAQESLSSDVYRFSSCSSSSSSSSQIINNTNSFIDNNKASGETLYDDADDEVCLHPDVARGTAAVWAKRPLGANTVAYWEVAVNGCYGTSIQFGIGTRRTHVQTRGCKYVDLLGGFSTAEQALNQRESFGLNHLGEAVHAGRRQRFCTRFPKEQPLTVGMLFNGPEGTLEYWLDGRWLGVAFCWTLYRMDDRGEGNNSIYFPMISCTAQGCKFTIHNQRSMEVVPSLKLFCRRVIVKSLMPAVGNHQMDDDITTVTQCSSCSAAVWQLPLPRSQCETLALDLHRLNQLLMTYDDRDGSSSGGRNRKNLPSTKR